MIKHRLFNYVKRIVPKISKTELIALESGTTCLDRNIFEGNVVYPGKKEIPKEKFNPLLLNTFNFNYGHLKKVYPKIEGSDTLTYNDVFEFMGKNKFFSFIIDEKYGGLNLSVRELSSVLTKITSFNPCLGIIAMVPNSLGPGELLQHYGTEIQKTKYLPGLATGTLIPCFGLTGPHNGSDATGSIDSGEVIINSQGKKVVNLTINKRYITLAPVANLIGIAFNLNDPSNLLDSGEEGVTLMLIDRKTDGLVIDTHHNPLDTGFPNGTLKGTLEIPVENIIGGEKNAGNGWKMLMECLAAGRGVCLPATANASSKVSTLGILQYAKHRKQFKIPLIKMEGVQEKIAEMLFHTWLIQCSVKITNELLDNGEKPGVISAIMKQQTTDRAREVLNHAMDIHAGSAICVGDNNFLEKFYKSAPIGITVEGSNVLTRNLMIFGQGLNKSHPYIYPILQSIIKNDVDEFYDNFKNILEHSIHLYFKSFSNMFSNSLEQQTVNFACLANFVALNGGALKSKQMLSGDMADILSNLYLAHSVKWVQDNENTSSNLTNYCINRLINENNVIINRIIENENLNIPLFFMKKQSSGEQYQDKRLLINEMLKNDDLIESLKADIHIPDTPLEKLFKLDEYDQNTADYKLHYNEMIKVSEYPNPKEGV